MKKEFENLVLLKRDFLNAHRELLKRALERGIVEFRSEKEANEFYMLFSRVHSKRRKRGRKRKIRYNPEAVREHGITARHIKQMERSREDFRKERFYELHAFKASMAYHEYRKALRAGRSQRNKAK